VPPDDGVGLHDEHGAAPFAPRPGEKDPKESVPGAKPGTLARTCQGVHLLSECEILERDRPVSAADQADGSKEYERCGQHDRSGAPAQHKINRWTGDQLERQNCLTSRPKGERITVRPQLSAADTVMRADRPVLEEFRL
jgi:hypothetical protein